MTLATILKLVLLLVGIVVFASGVYTKQREVRWAGIALIAVAFLLRLVPKERRPED